MAIMAVFGIVCRYFCLVGLFLILPPGCSASSASTASTGSGTTPSKLAVSGNRIVNDSGQAVRLRGVNFIDPFQLDKDDMNLDGVVDRPFANMATDFARVKALGANIVRMPIYPGYYFLAGAETYLSTYVDRMVDLAEENGLYALISYHAIGRPGGFYESDSDATLVNYPAKLYYTDSDMAVAFWDKVAARYGQRKHVLFGIYNEPIDKTSTFTWSEWRTTGDLLIQTVRRHSSNIIVAPGGTHYTDDLSQVSGSPYSDSNVVYDVHIYPSTVASREDLVTDWERRFGSLSATYPVIIGEWGFRNGGGETSNGTLEGYGKPFMNYIDQKNIPWIAFIYHPPDSDPPMLESDWTILNEFGNLVKERLR